MAMNPWRDAVFAGDLVVVSGQLGIAEGKGLVSGDGQSRHSLVAAQTRQALKNLVGVLAENGLTAADVIKTTVYLQTTDDYKAMNEEYAKVFHTNPPARTTIGAQLVIGAAVEIDCWAYRSKRS
ncbi:RidA family protein [Bradyrhizobium niftali]|uniref:RidA family protein n=1 Tax=Bradyrhizobium niftali TaxID=2560055 RepID=A0A4Y9KWX7_9BRAD|nr:RidA family protein [Bradyrhizobium niftali]TFV35635.1 RidA family protein [Bradyrhizobium niftali]